LNSEFRGHVPCDCDVYLPPVQQELTKDKSLREREAIAELLSGALTTHGVYIARKPSAVIPSDAEQVPYFSFCMASVNVSQMAEQIEQNPGNAIALSLYQNSNRPGITFNYLPGPIARYLLREMDGQNTIRDITNRVVANDSVKKMGFDARGVKEELRNLVEFFQPFG
jgi:hypothetical protein